MMTSSERPDQHGSSEWLRVGDNTRHGFPISQQHRTYASTFWATPPSRRTTTCLSCSIGARGDETTPQSEDAGDAGSTPRRTVDVPRHSRGAPSKPNALRGMAISARTPPPVGRNVSAEGSHVGDHVRGHPTIPRSSTRSKSARCRLN